MGKYSAERPELIPEPERIRSLVKILETASLDNGLSQAIDQAEDFHPQPVIDALLRGTLRRSGGAAVNFAGLLMFLHGKAESAFDWDQRPFFLTSLRIIARSAKPLSSNCAPRSE